MELQRQLAIIYIYLQMIMNEDIHGHQIHKCAMCSRVATVELFLHALVTHCTGHTHSSTWGRKGGGGTIGFTHNKQFC